MRIGVVNFLNAWPLWAALENKPGITLVPDVPSVLARKLRAGEVDAALISSVEFFRLNEGYTYHPGLCIGADAEVSSIRLFVPERNAGLAATIAKTRTIYTDIASRSSVAQLQVVLHRLKADIPRHEVTDAEARIFTLKPGEALLTIGDTALRHRQRASFDMQTEYFALFHHGFVYALWVYPKGLQDQLKPLFDESYAAYVQNEAVFRNAAIGRFGFSAEFTEHYLTRIISYPLTAKRQADLDFFAAALP